MRRLITFDCHGETLVGSLDEAPGSTGLLIVSGGNEVRHGAHRGMARLAAALAVEGSPVFRYDRRGIGDSSGLNGGFGSAREDLLAAVAAFRAASPGITRLVGFGNCDAASTLALWGAKAGLDAVVLANPWVVEPTDDLPPPAAIRARYARQLRSPIAWARLLRGDIDFRKAFNGLRKVARDGSQPASTLQTEVMAGIQQWGERASVVLAQGDATALAYADATRRAGLAPPTRMIDTASHSFARMEDAAALHDAVRAALR